MIARYHSGIPGRPESNFLLLWPSSEGCQKGSNAVIKNVTVPVFYYIKPTKVVKIFRTIFWALIPRLSMIGFMGFPKNVENSTIKLALTIPASIAIFYIAFHCSPESGILFLWPSFEGCQII